VRVSVDASRMCEVVSTLPGGVRVRGSGFLLRSGVVVTAWHVVEDAVVVSCRFETGSDREWSAEMGSRVRLGRSDVALVVLDQAKTAAAKGVELVGVGGFGNRAVAIKAVTFGFPRWKLRDKEAAAPAVDGGKSRFRELAQVPAGLASAANRRSGGCELVVAAPEPDARHPRVSAWEGMSGGPVFVDELLVGVVTDHHRQEGLGRLAAARLDMCLADLTDLPAGEVQQVLALLGLASPGEVRLVGVPPWAAWKRQALVDQLAEIVPVDGLLDREQELAELAGLCAGADSYVYWQGGHGRARPR